MLGRLGGPARLYTWQVHVAGSINGFTIKRIDYIGWRPVDVCWSRSSHVGVGTLIEHRVLAGKYATQ